MHYYKFNIAEWVKDTSHLSLKEEAILLRLFNHYVNTERCIPTKTQMVLRKLRLTDESESVKILLDEFFDKRKDGYHIDDLDKIIEDYQARAERNRKNGKSGGRPKINNLGKPSGLPVEKQVDTNSKPDGNLNYKLLTNNEELETNKEKPPKDNCRFAEFWDMYGKKTGKDACEKKFKKLNNSEVEKIFSVLPSYVASTPDVQYRKNPSTWLNQKCWEDELEFTQVEKTPQQKQYDHEAARQREIEEIRKGFM